MNPIPSVLRARHRYWPSLSLFAAVFALILAPRVYHLTPSAPQAPDYLPDPPPDCYIRAPTAAECAFSSLIDAPSPGIVALSAKGYTWLAGGRWPPPPGAHAPLGDPPHIIFHPNYRQLQGWEGITDRDERFFLSAVLALSQSPPDEPSTDLDEKRKLVSIRTHYERLLYDAWAFDTAKRKQEVLEENRARYQRWQEQLDRREVSALFSALMPHPCELLLLLIACAGAGIGGIAWQRRASVRVSERGMRLAGRTLAWSEIDEMDIYPSRLELRLFDGTRHICQGLSISDEEIAALESVDCGWRALQRAKGESAQAAERVQMG